MTLKLPRMPRRLEIEDAHERATDRSNEAGSAIIKYRITLEDMLKGMKELRIYPTQAEVSMIRSQMAGIHSQVTKMDQVFAQIDTLMYEKDQGSANGFIGIC